MQKHRKLKEVPALQLYPAELRIIKTPPRRGGEGDGGDEMFDKNNYLLFYELLSRACARAPNAEIAIWRLRESNFAAISSSSGNFGRKYRGAGGGATAICIRFPL